MDPCEGILNHVDGVITTAGWIVWIRKQTEEISGNPGTIWGGICHSLGTVEARFRDPNTMLPDFPGTR